MKPQSLLNLALILMMFTSCSKQSETSAQANMLGNELKSASLVQVLNEGEAPATQGVIQNCIDVCVSSLPNEPLSQAEIDAITFVREEELLAYDVYNALYQRWRIPVFRNIAKSEDIHTYAVKALIAKYNLPDPGAGHQAGVFVNTQIQQLFDQLSVLGISSLNSAMIVGATIEDMDIADLRQHLLNDLDNQDALFVFNQLYQGSRNHLRAFAAQLRFRNITYSPQYISQELYDQITNSNWEVGNGFCLCQTATGSVNDRSSN
jgi:hypothetical protein